MQKRNDIKEDVIDNILGGDGDEFADRVEELNCLIYKNDPDSNDKSREYQDEKTYKVSKENVSVQVWEGKAKIKVKVSPGGKSNISMKRIANIAVDAIIEELQKGD